MRNQRLEGGLNENKKNGDEHGKNEMMGKNRLNQDNIVPMERKGAFHVERHIMNLSIRHF